MRLSVLCGEVDVDDSHIAESSVEVRRQIRAYERGGRRTFDLTVDVPDSFAGTVMREVGRIPYGETRTYGELAAALDTAPIAVGAACGRNPVPLIVPCHRLVAADGSLRGYVEPGGVELKRRLLDHERRIVEVG